MKNQCILADIVRNGASEFVHVGFSLYREPAVGLHDQSMHQHAFIHPEFGEEQYTKNTKQDPHLGQDREKTQKNRPSSSDAENIIKM